VTSLTGGRTLAHYAPTKAAVLSLTQSLAAELGPLQIRCNALLPGTIWTQMTNDILQNEQKNAFMAKKAALGRLGTPRDLAGPAVFLASEMSAYMTGSQLLVDGGMFANFL
jgi:L-rhamnose 1-dehydrogenase